MLFFSRSRADLGLTLVLAAATALLTLVLFKLDDDVQLLQYNRDMRPASCTVVSGAISPCMIYADVVGKIAVLAQNCHHAQSP